MASGRNILVLTLLSLVTAFHATRGQEVASSGTLEVGFKDFAFAFVYGDALSWDTPPHPFGRPTFNSDLKKRSDLLLDEISKAAELSMEQQQAVSWAMSNDGIKVARQISDQIQVWKTEGLKIRSVYYTTVEGLAKNIFDYPTYLSRDDNLTVKVLEAKLDARQKRLLRDFYLRKFLARFNDLYNLNDADAAGIRQLVDSKIDQRGIVIDPKVFYKYLKEATLSELESHLGTERSKTMHTYLETTDDIFKPEFTRF